MSGTKEISIVGIAGMSAAISCRKNGYVAVTAKAFQLAQEPI